MLKEIFKYIHDLKRPETIAVGNKEFMLSDYEPLKESIASPLGLNTLTGIVNYIKTGIDSGASEGRKRIIHVAKYNSVELLTELFGSWQQREVLLQANADTPKSISGAWMDTEDFIINVNSKFEHTEDFNYLVGLVSGLSDKSSTEMKDNGIAQSTVVKSGLSMLAEVEVKSPITLQPFRTFPEIDQPKIEYVFRMRKGQEGQPPSCAIFEADGGRWRLQTIHAIEEWLDGNLSDSDVEIIA